MHQQLLKTLSAIVWILSSLLQGNKARKCFFLPRSKNGKSEPSGA
jgi:hypothetical protein